MKFIFFNATNTSAQGWRWMLTLSLTAVGALGAAASFAQAVASSPLPGASIRPSVASEAVPATRQVPAAPTGALWAALKSHQKQALLPLAPSWESMSEAHRRKWLEISRSFGGLSAVDQARLHSRMSEWTALTPSERAKARLNFAETTEYAKELTPDEKKAKWDSYQSLSSEEKKQLADQARRTPLGAAPATRPVSRQKLASVPTPAEDSVKSPKIQAVRVEASSATASSDANPTNASPPP